MKKSNKELIRHLIKRVAVTDAKVIQLVSEMKNTKEALLILTGVVVDLNKEVLKIGR